MQNALRVWRTVRHLSYEQFLFRAINRGKRVLYRVAGGPVERHLRRRIALLPEPDWSDDCVHRFADLMLHIQTAKYAKQSADIRSGSFTLLNRRVSFAGPAAVEWRRDLGEDNNPLWRMNLSYMGYAVPLLATGRDEDLALVESLVESLEAQNPWNVPGVFRDVWFSYAVSHRIINLLAGIACWQRASVNADLGRANALTRHIKLCVEFLRRNLERELQFNHLLKNLVALKCYESAVARPETCQLVDEGFLLRVVEQQLLPDGGHIERSPMYHSLFIQDLQLLNRLRWRSDTTRLALEDAERRAIGALAHMTHAGNRRFALMNDSWLGESLSPAHFIGDEELLPPESAHTLNDTGYTRIHCGAFSVIFDCGAAGPDNNLGHAHADFLAVEAMYGDVPWIMDPGTPIYTAGALRDWSRSAACHNGPAIEDAEPLEFWKSFRVGRRGYGYPIDASALPWETKCAAAGFQTGYRHVGCIAGRFLEVTRGGDLLILDVWNLRDSRRAPVSSWLISEAWDVSSESSRVRMRHGDSVLEWRFVGATEPELGSSDYYEEFGVAKRGTTIRARPREAGTWRWLAIIVQTSGRDSAVGPDPERALSWMQDRLAERLR
jgi:hypothetical protein